MRRCAFYLVLLCSLLLPMPVIAGSLEPPAAPLDPASGMHTLDDIYNYLDGNYGEVNQTPPPFKRPNAGPAPFGHTTNDIMLLLKNRSLLGKTGQTRSYGPGDDGALQNGRVWPSPRFVDNGNGTVTDKLTNLIWLKDANCYGPKAWNDALTTANSLTSGSCGLTDGSTAGQWRLPNWLELISLVDMSQTEPALPTGHPFSNVQSNYYWSSNTSGGHSSLAWYVYLGFGNAGNDTKSSSYYFWPIRGGQ